MFLSPLWAHRTSAKTSTGLNPFQLVYNLEFVLHIECEIPSLKIATKLLPATSEEEELFLYLEHLYETRCIVALGIKAHKKHIKA